MVTVCLVVTSCASRKKIQESLTISPQSIRYLYDSEPLNCNRDKVIYLELNDSIPFNNVTPLNKDGGGALPLLVVNVFWENYEVLMGQDMIYPSYHQFFSESIVAESKRTGCFTLKEGKLDNNGFILKLSIDKCQTKGRLTSTFGIIALSGPSSTTYSFKPVNTELIVNVKLFQNNLVIFNKKYVLNHHQPFLSIRHKRTYANNHLELEHNMVESLSFATKKIIEDMIEDINNVMSSD